MFLVYAYFLINFILAGKIVYNLFTKYREDKESWGLAKTFIPMTLLFGTVLFIKTYLAERNGGGR